MSHKKSPTSVLDKLKVNRKFVRKNKYRNCGKFIISGQICSSYSYLGLNKFVKQIRMNQYG